MRMMFRVVFCLFVALLCVAEGHAATIYEREIVVTDESRRGVAERAFQELLAAYEQENPREFLRHVSAERFRQNYMLFEDALYEDMRNYEIHRVDFWINRVVRDGTRFVLYAKWEKRFETLSSALLTTTKGVSRFVFDDIEGDYKLVELAGDDLFGSSYDEWVTETPSIPGQIGIADLVPIKVVVSDNAGDGTTGYYDFTFFVKNTGAGKVAQCTVTVTGNDTGATPYNASATLPSVAAGATVQLKMLDFSNLTPEKITVNVDSGNAVAESNEANNEKTVIDVDSGLPVGTYLF